MMRLGVENRRMLGLLAVSLVVAVFTSARMVRSLQPQHAATSAPATVMPEGGRQQARATNRHRGQPTTAASLDPTLRLDLLRASQETEYRGSGRNIFQSGPVEIPKPVANVMKPAGASAAAGPPPPPPINLQFFGFASRPGEPKKVFLVRGDDVFIGGEGDIVDRRYRIVRIGVNSVEVEDLQYKHRQTLPLS